MKPETTQTNKTTIVKHYKIPQDLIMDILRILFGNKIKHAIEGVKEKENIVLIQVYWIAQNTIHQQAKQNLEGLLGIYSEDMDGLLSDATLFMDGEE